MKVARMKTPLSFENRKFDLKIMLSGVPGSGKTHFCGTYTKGPVHFYVFDKGGEKTLEKIVKENKESNLTIDKLAADSDTFSNIWKLIQKDGRKGFFEEMASQNGLVIFDSLTNLNKKAIEEIKKKADIPIEDIGEKADPKKGMKLHHWGQLFNWMQTFVNMVQGLPCAIIVTSHIRNIMDNEMKLIAREPYVNGQFKDMVLVDFDESYVIEYRGGAQRIYLNERERFPAKTRVFTEPKFKDCTMDMIYEAYLQ